MMYLIFTLTSFLAADDAGCVATFDEGEQTHDVVALFLIQLFKQFQYGGLFVGDLVVRRCGHGPGIIGQTK